MKYDTMSWKSKRGLGKRGLGPKGANQAKEGCCSPLPGGAEVGPGLKGPKNARFSKKDFCTIFSEF